MEKKAKVTTKVLSIILAVVMLIGIIPTTVFAIDNPLNGSTGSGWADFGGEYIDSEAGDIIIDSGDSSGSLQSGSDSSGDTVDSTDLDDADDSNTATSPTSESNTDVALGASGIEETTLSPAQLFNQQFQEYQEWSQGVQNSRASLMRASVSVSTNDIALNGKITWESGSPSDPYFISSTLPKITLNGNTAFCFDFNSRMPGGNYTAGGTYSDTAILKILANYKANPSNASYVAAQVAIWQYLTTGSVNLSKVDWGGATGSSAASAIFSGSASYSGKVYTLYVGGSQDIIQFTANTPNSPYTLKIIKKNADGTKVISGATFSISGPNGFNKTGLKTNSSGEIVVGIDSMGQYTVTETAPPAGYKLADPNTKTINVTASHTQSNPAVVEFRNEIDPDNPGGGEGETTTETETETETEVHNSKEYSYSDAIGVRPDRA